MKGMSFCNGSGHRHKNKRDHTGQFKHWVFFSLAVTKSEYSIFWGSPHAATESLHFVIIIQSTDFLVWSDRFNFQCASLFL